jgi:hypothetical protein
MINEIPRINILELNTPAELAILNAIQEVEKMGCDVKLTNIICELSKLRNDLADFTDGITKPVDKDLIDNEKKIFTKDGVEFTTETLLKYYMNGFNDELNGEEKLLYDDKLVLKAYNLGRCDAYLGDDSSLIDAQTHEEIIKRILS